MKYSTTYIFQTAQWLSMAFVLVGINVGVDELTTTLSVTATVLSGVGVLIGRWKAGGITWFGTRTA